MTLLDVVRRRRKPEPWAEGEKIPWWDPDFSERMLGEHLSQAHDAASRRAAVIDSQLRWIHGELLRGAPTRVLDLCCGPGLYTSRLAKLGHECVGIDFSPASIRHAREHAEREGLRCTYLEADVRDADYGEGYGLAMLLSGEFNVFRRSEASAILAKARAALASGGCLLLEPHTVSGVRGIGEQLPSWYAVERGLFSNRPHVYLCESFWDAQCRTATERHFVIDAASGSVSRHAASLQAYTETEYESLLTQCGFAEVELRESLSGDPDEHGGDLLVAVARR